MAKRIFKVIGIVLAGVLGLVGGIVGVLAIMGKFKTPVVYPKQLVFAEPEMMIVDAGEYDNTLNLSDGENGIYSFTLVGESGKDQEVTKKDCLLTITSGANLIQLCDENGETSNVEKVNGKYKIKCNEKTYFRLKQLPNEKLSGLTYGKVSLKAEDERMMTSTGNNGLTIWIDRMVKNIALNESQMQPSSVENFVENNKAGRQYTVGLEESLAFDAVTTPIYALNPISKANYSGKIVEYYYYEKDAMTDWAYIDKNNLEAYPFLTYNQEEDMLYFKADSTDLAGKTYQFRVAVFASYAARERYLASIENNSDDISNLDRMTEMVWSRFNVVVKSTKITSIGSETANIDLSLFEKNNNLIMNSNAEGFKNLRLYMIGAGTRTYLRFDEADFDLRTIGLLKDKQTEAMVDINTVWFKSYLASDFSSGNVEVLNLNSKVGNTFIDFFVYDATKQSYRLATQTEFNYTATHIADSRGENRAFNISVKSMPALDDGLQLVLGVMVVNNTGEYYFTSIDVSVVENDLEYTYVDDLQEHTLTIDYVKDRIGNYTSNPSCLNFEDIVSVNAGSYRACVFVTPKNDRNEYDIEVLPNVVYTKNVNGEPKQYVLVGYFEAGKFVNQVKAKDGAKNVSTKLYLLQLKNTYETNFEDETFDAAEQYINSIFTQRTFNAETNQYVNTFVYSDEINYTIGKQTEAETPDLLLNGDKGERFVADNKMVVINIKYQIPDAVEFESFNNNTRNDLVTEANKKVNLVAGFEYTVTLSSDVKNLLKNVFYAQVDNVESFKQYLSILVFDGNGNIVESDSMLNIVDAVLNTDDENVNPTITITFSVNENANSAALTNPRTYKLRFAYGDVVVDSDLIYVVTDKPNNITLAFATGDAEGKEATQVINNIELGNAVVNVKIGCEEATQTYTYTYTLNNKANGNLIYAYEQGEFVLNANNVEFSTIPRFYVSPDYRDTRGDKNEILYSIAGIGYVTDLSLLPVGNYDLVVSTYGDVSRVLSVVVTAPTDSSLTEYFTYNSDVSSATVKDETTYRLNAGNTSSLVAKGVGYSYVKTGEDGLKTVTYLPEKVNINLLGFNFSGSENLQLITSRDESNNITGYALKTIVEEGEGENVLTIERSAGDWLFTRLKFINTRLSISIAVKMDAFADAINWQITFESSRQIDMNKAWTDIYANTNIQLIESRTSSEEAFTTNALFQITNNTAQALTCNIYALGSNGVYDRSINYGGENISDGVLSLNAGTYLVEFLDNNNELLETFSNIIVKQNYFAGWKNISLVSEKSNYNLTDLVTLQQYGLNNNSGKTYGSEITNLIYNAEDLINLDNYAGFGLNCDKTTGDGAQLVVLSNGIVSVGYVKELNTTTTCNLTLLYNGEVVGQPYAANIVNKYSASIENSNFMVNRDNLTNSVKLTEKNTTGDGNVLVNSVISVSVDEVYNLTENVVTKNISEKTNIQAVYTFVVDGKQYTYNAEITLLPYVPATKSDSNQTETYSQNNQFDVINNIFNFTYNDQGIISDSQIKNLYVDKVLLNGQEYYDCFTMGNQIIGVGYTLSSASASNTKFIAPIGVINGKNQYITIRYHIEYVDGVVYTYEHSVQIKNYLSVEAQYPFNNKTTNSQVYMVAVDGKTNDVINFGNQLGDNKYTNRGNNIFGFEMGLKYEPVTINQVVDLQADASLDVYRALVKNLALDGKQSQEDIASVELVAFESNQNARYYLNSIKIDGTTITFNASETFSAGSSAYFLFKINLTSGNYGFYLVRLHKQTDNFAGLTLADVVKEVEAADNIDIAPKWDEIYADNKTLKQIFGITTNQDSEWANIKKNIHYYLLSVKANGNTAVGAFDIEGIKANTADTENLFENKQYAELVINEDTYIIANPNKFVQIKLGLVYADENRTMYLGSYTTSVSVTTNLNIYDETNNPEGLLNKKSGEFGSYTATLESLATKSILLAGVEDVDVNIESIELTGTTAGKFNTTNIINDAGTRASVKITPKNSSTSIVEIVGANITVNTFIDTDLTFVVKYNVNGAIINIEFNFEAVIVDQIGNVVLGSFDTSTGFNTTLDLKSRIGNYTGQIEYTDTFSEAIKGNFDVDAKTIDYNKTQTTKTNQGVATLTLSQLLDVDTAQYIQREINVVVYPAYHVEQGMGGGTETSPYQAEKIANNFASPVGSKAVITKIENSVLNYNTYMLQNGSVGGLKIYVKNTTSLSFAAGTIIDGTELGENCAKYVVKDQASRTLLASDGNIEVDQSAEISFVHMAQSKTILLTISLIDGGELICDRNNSSKGLTINLYVTLPSTYTNLKANYTIANANHDNFVTNTNQDNILAYLFGNAFGDAGNENGIYSSMRMTLVAGLNSKGEDDVVESFDAVNMGFYDKSNPNYLKLVLGDGLRYENGTTDGDYNLIIGSVSNSTQTWLRLNNAVGLESEAYIINILTEADKLVYQADGDDQLYLTNHSQATDEKQYASVVVKDNDKEAGFDYSLINTQNKIAKIYDVRNNVFKIANVKATIDGNNANVLLTQATNDGQIIDGSYLLKISQGQVVYTLAIYRSENREIMFNITRLSTDEMCENLVVNFDVYTNSGLVCKDFALNVFNYNIAANLTEFYATETFELKDLFDITSNISNANIDAIAYNLVLNDSYYVIDGKRVYITSYSNNLFEFNQANSTITTYQVPEQVQLNLFVQVNKNNQIVDVVESVITIKRNIQFMVNEEAAAPGSQFSTDYKFADVYMISEGKITELKPANLISDLGLTLNYVKNGVSITIQPDITTIAVSQVEIADYTGNKINNYVELNADYSLNFKRDFTGVVTISLAYKTNSGYFRQYWDINVTGLQTFAYANNPTYPLVDNGVSYASGKTVDIVNPSTSNNPAIVSTSNVANNKVDYKIKAQYIILDSDTFNNNVDMDYLLNNSTFGSATNVTGFDGSETLNNVAIKTTLPLVPQSKADNPVDYYVVYRIQYSYAGANIQPYFAIYKVRNVATVTLAPNVNTTINVDDNATNAIYDDLKLKLFYYVETFGTTETGLTTLQYLGQNKFKLNETEYDETSFSIVNNTLTIGEYEFDYSTAVPTVKIGANKGVARTGITTYLLDGTTTKTMFNSDYANTLRFKDFVDNISKITINDVDYVCESDNQKLVNIDGVIALDLSGETLFTNSAETQLKIYLKGSAQPIDAFDISLFGNNSITPKGKLWLSQIFQDGGYKTDYQITGISTGNPEANWFNGNNITVNKNDRLISSFDVSIGQNKHTFAVYQVDVGGDSDSGIYSVNASYYYLVAQDLSSATIYAVDYLSRGESNCFRVQYEQGKASTIDLSKAVKKYYNNSEGILVGEPVDGLTVTNAEFEYNISTSNIAAVSVAEEELFVAKQNHKDETYISAKLTLSQSGLIALVRFELPELTFVVNYIPTTDESSTSFVVFDLSKIETDIIDCRNVLVYDENNNGYISLNDENQIVMNTLILNEYKTANTEAKYMKVNYKLTYTKLDSTGAENQIEVDFAIMWALSAT